MTIDPGMIEWTGQSLPKGGKLPKKNVTTSFTQVQNPDNYKRKPVIVKMNTPNPLTPLTQFVTDHQEEGISTLALIRGFQETCKHKMVVLARQGSHYAMSGVSMCVDCGATAIATKSAVAKK